jgi:hypothetical protein
VATPLLAADGSLIAAISAATDDPAEADSLDDLGEELKKAIATLGPPYGLGRAKQAVQRADHPAWNPDQPGGSGRLPERGTRAAAGSGAPFGWPALILGM